ncbi:MAG: thioredoxin domain-containing protein [Myxococcales bacterium]|nr:MAG: thioredoxin domain-containing protein [Myxococcales bacterium]
MAKTDASSDAPAGLLQEEQDQWRKLVSSLQAPCATKQSILQCKGPAPKDASCSPTCELASEYIARLVSNNYPTDSIGDLYRLRFDSRAKVAFDYDSIAFRGNQDAEVTILAFSDFECPFCALTASLLEQLLEEYDGKIRIGLKHFPLPQHEMAIPAAKAAIAAQAQDKFWPMHDALFQNQRELSEKSILASAKKIGLDLKRFKKDWKSEQTQALLDADLEQAQGLGLRGTPTLFINGRLFAEPFEALKPYLEEEFSVAALETTAANESAAKNTTKP